MAVAITRTNSSPDSTSGTATSCSSKLSGPPNFVSTIAFICASPVGGEDERGTRHRLYHDRQSDLDARPTRHRGCAWLTAARWSIRLLGIQTLALDPAGFLDLRAAVVSRAPFGRLS